MTTLFIISILIVVVAQAIYIRRLEHGCFDAMSHAAGFIRLALLQFFHIPTAIVALDIRGMHELNAVLGYELASRIVSRVIRVHDNRCQWGGDEIVIFIPFAKPGTAAKILSRVLAQCRQTTSELTALQCQELYTRTAGKIDGIHVAIVATERTTRSIDAIQTSMDKIEEMKEGGCPITGNRATTGNPGTLQHVF